MSGEEPVVFVVDDDPAIREAIRSLFSSAGLRVETFGTAQEFLRIERPDAPACLVLDPLPHADPARRPPERWYPAPR